MTALTINDKVRRITGQQLPTVSDADIRDTYIPFGLSYLNKVTKQTLSISNYTSSSLSDSHNEEIVAELAAWRMDQEYGVVKIDPETGRPINKHFDAANSMLSQLYGTYLDGNLILPIQLSATTSDFTWGRADSTLRSEDTDKETTVNVNKRVNRFGQSFYGEDSPDQRIV